MSFLNHGKSVPRGWPIIAKRCKTIIGIIEVDDEEECTIVYDGEILLDE